MGSTGSTGSTDRNLGGGEENKGCGGARGLEGAGVAWENLGKGDGYDAYVIQK